jgi:UrcA family protein
MFHLENSMNFIKTVPTKVLLTAILAAVSYTTHASGADGPSGSSVTIRYDDLNLSVPADVASLKQRVSRAAEQVCADQYGSDPIGRTLWQSCVRRTTEKTLAQVKWPEK